MLHKTLRSPALAGCVRAAATAGLAALVLGPLVWSLGAAWLAGLDAAAWQTLWHTPHAAHALGQSLYSGLTASALAMLGCGALLAHTVGRLPTPAQSQRMAGTLAALLAVPHAAFAIGVAALIAPSGWLLRLLSPWATGLDAPPPWPTTQDPWSLGLIGVLVCKEIPFLLWTALAHLQRPDVAQRLRRELLLAHTMGYSPRAAWWRVGWPQLLAHQRAPLLAVLAYNLTAVDVALLIGPSSPPTLAVLAWQWLQDADPATNALGGAAAWMLAGVLGAGAALAAAVARAPLWRIRASRGLQRTAWRPDVLLRPGAARPGAVSPSPGTKGLLALRGVYAAVLLALLLGSVVGSWPFPALWPHTWTGAAWRSVASSSAHLGTTLWLGAASATSALVWVVAWLECAPAAWQRRAQPLLMLPLVLPVVLWTLGLHRLSLAWGVDASAAGLWLAHTLAALPYVLIGLQGPYLGMDPRLRHISATLGHSHAVFLLRVKWPLLRGPLAAAWAIGFAVSVAQYLPTLYVGAGRFATLTTEAMTVAAGGQRSLGAAYAWLLWLLPAIGFALAARLGATPRRRSE